MTTTDWRGRAVTNDDDDLPIDESVSRRREARTLLGGLLRPYATAVALLVFAWARVSAWASRQAQKLAQVAAHC